jgi:hypothetical protein
LLRDLEIGDDAVAQRPDRLNVARRAAEHQLGFLADRQDVLAALDAGDRDNRRLVQDDATTLHVDEGVGRPEVDRHVGGQQPQHSTNHCQNGSKVAAEPSLSRA